MHLAGGVSVWHFLVHDPAPSSHPLHVTRAQGARVAKAVTVIHGAVQHIRNGFDAAVRVPWETFFKMRRKIVSKIVKQQKWIKL